MQELTFAEAQDAVEEAIALDNPVVFLASMLGGREVPQYINALRGMMLGIGVMQDFLQEEHGEDYDGDCNNGACFHRPHHKHFARDAMTDSANKAEQVFQQLKHDCALFVCEMSKCQCAACKHGRQVDAAQYN
jgi:hypothetical protein